MIKLNLDKNKKYILACSFGPDSMALLDACIKEKLNIVVAHVNYRKRAVSINEQENLTKYCDERNIKIYVLDLLGVKHTGNFQEWARKVRYDFFKEVLEKENADFVLVAHQQDDVIETYLMQKKRGNHVKFAGICRQNELFGSKIIRPLLNYSKKFLEEYDIKNNVPFSIDESNLSDCYTRNNFRHHIVEKLSSEERNRILDEINQVNNKPKFSSKLKTKEQFLSLDYDEIIEIFNKYMELTGEHRDLSKKFVSEMKKAVRSKNTISFEITKSIIFECSYDAIYFVNKKKIHDYNYVAVNKLETPFLSLDFSNGTDDRKIELKNKEIVIKNLKKNDKYIIKDYSVKINRLFIDWKMPLFLRNVWPGIYDKKGNLIYVPRYRKAYIDNHSSKFLINTKYFEEF